MLPVEHLLRRPHNRPTLLLGNQPQLPIRLRRRQLHHSQRPNQKHTSPQPTNRKIPHSPHRLCAIKCIRWNFNHSKRVCLCSGFLHSVPFIFDAIGTNKSNTSVADAGDAFDKRYAAIDQNQAHTKKALPIRE